MPTDCEYLDEWAPDTRHAGRDGTGGLARIESIASWISHCLLSGEYEQLASIHLLPHYSPIVSHCLVRCLVRLFLPMYVQR